MGIVTGTLEASSNRADLMFQVKMINALRDGDTIDWVGALVTVALRPFSGNGVLFAVPTLTGTNLDGHVTIFSGIDTFEVRFTRAEMSQFPAGDLDMGITLLQADGRTYQLFKGQVPVVDGVVPQ